MLNEERKQILSSYGVKLIDDPRCVRMVLPCGTQCNCRCVFCYFKDRLNQTCSFDDIKTRINIMAEYGCTQADLTGGEPSIRKDFFDILDYCHSKGMETSCLSNGWKFADMNFIKEAQKHGLNEILFSLHGSNAELHDSIVQKKGAFKRLIQAIKNAKELGFRVRLNCTIFSQNAASLENEYPELLLKLEPFEINFIEVNYWSDNKEFYTSDTKVTTDYLKKCIDKVKDKMLVNVRYVPFCYMKGYEKYNTNYFQIIFDIYDWELAGYTFVLGHHGNKIDPKYKGLSEYEKLKLNYAAARHNRNQSFDKHKECLKCKHYYICDGIKKALRNVIKPMPDTVEDMKDQIKDPLYYRHGFFD